MDFDADFDRDLLIWRARADELVDEGLALFVGLERLPCPDGRLHDLVTMLAALPVSSRHEAAILRLLGRSDPHFQEAGLRLATAAGSARGLPGAGGSSKASVFAGPIAALLRARSLDPTVFEAAVEWLESRRGLGEQLDEVLDAAIAAAERPVPRDLGGIRRMRVVDPSARLDSLLDQLLGGGSGQPSPALLARLERRHGTKGLEATKAAAWGREP